MDTSDHLFGFFHGILSDRTRIDDHQLSIIQVASNAVAFCLKGLRPGFQFGFIEAAAQGF